MKYYASIDIGGTAIKYGVISQKGILIEKHQMPTEAFKGGPGILKKAISIVDKFKNSYELSGICISTAGMVDVEKGEIFYSAPLIPNYTGTAFKKVMEEAFHIPCEVENDVNCAGLAENISGAAEGSKVTLCLTIGTGIGGCIVVNGNVFRGFSGSACEVGYMHMLGSDFQTLGASSILSRNVAAKKGGTSHEWNGIRIFQLAKSGDEICMDAIDEMCDILGMGIANICYVINPQVIVLGGGIMAQESYLRPRIDDALAKYLIPDIKSRTRLEFAKHQNDAGMLGAFYHFQKRTLWNT